MQHYSEKKKKYYKRYYIVMYNGHILNGVLKDVY